MRLKAEMYCPDCDCECNSDVIDTVARKTGYGEIITRRRACQKCGTRFTTYEISAKEYKSLAKVKKNLGKLEDALEIFMRFVNECKNGETACADDGTDACSGDVKVGCEYCKHKFREQHEWPCSLCQRNFMDMFEFEREVNADADSD
jgi:hypothetical protein